MKKILFTLFAAMLCSVAMADDQPIAYNQIPKSAQAFVTKHFNSAKVTAATKDAEFLGGAEYTVYLNDGAKVDFNSKGQWKEVDCGMKAVPAGIVPAKIAAFVKTNHAGAEVVKIDVDKTDYEVRLSNKMELKFNLNGDFIGIED